MYRLFPQRSANLMDSHKIEILCSHIARFRFRTHYSVADDGRYIETFSVNIFDVLTFRFDAKRCPF